MKSCPHCGAEYGDDVLVCSTDHYVLVTTVKREKTVDKRTAALAKATRGVQIAKKTWDFIFGILMIGTLPLVAFLFCAFFLSILFRGFGVAIALVTTVTVLICILNWRINNRLAPAAFFPMEIVLGIALAVSLCMKMSMLWMKLGP